MIFVKVPLINGEMDIDYRDMAAGFQLSEDQAFVCIKEGAQVKDSWELSTEEEFNSLKPVLPEPPQPGPSELDILGQQLVEKDLQIMELQNANSLLGQQVVALELNNMELQQQNDTIGQQLVNMDLRLLNLEMGGNA